MEKQQTNTSDKHQAIRCVNIDWLECYCLEDPISWPHDADYFRNHGYAVNERPYGTRVYHEMFTILDEYGEPFCEIRRDPVQTLRSGERSVLDPNACHVRLSNRSCYVDGVARKLATFLDSHGFWLQRISRIDLAYDFEKFDSGDDPAAFIRRYMRGKYSKIHQSNIRANGRDLWDGRDWNSLSWGSPTSMVSTKFYDKTMELREVKDKPYIRYAWFRSHLVDDYMKLTRVAENGSIYQPRIWRVEFSIKSSVKSWMIIEDNTTGKKKPRSIRNTLDCYDNAGKLWSMWASLAHHYFHFKHFVSDVRKYDCQDKTLFHFDDVPQFVSIERIPTSKPRETELDMLINRLTAWRNKSIDYKQNRVINDLLTMLEDKAIRAMAVQPYDTTEVRILRRLLAYRLAHPGESSIEADEAYIKSIIEFEDVF